LEGRTIGFLPDGHPVLLLTIAGQRIHSPIVQSSVSVQYSAYFRKTLHRC
jgi:hypothetical protein